MGHRKHHSAGEVGRPVADNAAAVAAAGHHAAAAAEGKQHHRRAHRKGKEATAAHDVHQGPQASSLPGHLAIITDVRKGRDHNLGVPGIISSTTMGPEQRNRLVSGIIETMMGHRAESGPVHAVTGHDATAYNEGMVHIAGSRFK